MGNYGTFPVEVLDLSVSIDHVANLPLFIILPGKSDVSQDSDCIPTVQPFVAGRHFLRLGRRCLLGAGAACSAASVSQ